MATGSFEEDMSFIRNSIKEPTNLSSVYREVSKERVFDKKFNPRLPPYSKDGLSVEYNDFMRILNGTSKDAYNKFHVPEDQILYQFTKKKIREISTKTNDSNDQNLRMIWSIVLEKPHYGKQLSSWIARETAKKIEKDSNFKFTDYCEHLEKIASFSNKWGKKGRPVTSEDFPKSL